MKKFFKIVISFIILILASIYILFRPENASKTIYHNYNKYGTVIINRDEFGISHIKGDNIVSVCFGQGYSQGQDRLFQMHLKRLFASGRISEMAGESTLGIDKYMRELGLNRQVKKMVQNIKPELFNCLLAFSEGINEYANNLLVLPLEFYLSGSVWENWTVSDSQLMFSLLSFQLIQDNIWEMFHSEIKEIYGEEIAREILGHNQDSQLSNVTIFNDDELKDIGIFSMNIKEKQNNETKTPTQNFQKQENIKYNKTQHKYLDQDQSKYVNNLEFLYSMYANPAGSNSWVISGNHTASGKPILCNDPHIPNVIPGNLHQTELIFTHQGQSHYSIGFTTSGIPFVVFGKTDYLSYGVTVSFMDTSDLYLEEINEQTKQYQLDGQMKNLQVIQEEIYIKGQLKPLIYEVYETHRGPVIHHIFNIFNKNPLEKLPKPCSLAWVGHLSKDNSLQAIYQITIAQRVSELDNLIKIFTAPGLMMNYATIDGDYGMSFIGYIPLRNEQKRSIFLKDGSTTYDDWIGFYKPEQIPNHRNSKKGFYVSANNRMASDNIKHDITVNHFATPRATRITEIISKQINKQFKFRTQDMMKLQSDVLDIYAREIVPGLIKIFEQYGNQFLNEQEIKNCSELIEDLKTWDYQFQYSNAKASIYIVWEYLFMQKIFQDIELERTRLYLQGSFFAETFIFGRLKAWILMNESYVEEFWCKDYSNKGYSKEQKQDNEKQENNCLKTLYLSLSEVKQFMIEFFKTTDKQQWKYGKLQTQQFHHSIFSNTLLSPIFDRQFEGSGHRRTVAVSMQQWYKQMFGSIYSAAMRMIISMDENEKSYWIIDTGASENIFSPHYDDQYQYYKQYKYIEMKYGEKHLDTYKIKTILKFEKKSSID